MMSCPDCGEGLDDVAVGQPCPQCGGLRRDASPIAQTATAHIEAFRPTIGIGYTGPRPWQQKWADVLRALEQLEATYTTKEGQGNEDVRRRVESFFEICRELADWLWQDNGTSLDKPTVMGFVLSDSHLRLADAMAQTTKHHTRTGSDPITARITNILVGPDGASAEIGWSQVSGASGSEDALNLARGYVQAWQSFLKQNGL
jgi:hypothetical protein